MNNRAYYMRVNKYLCFNTTTRTHDDKIYTTNTTTYIQRVCVQR